jgi:hypothetical protein
MKQFGDLNACISLLREVQRGGDVNPKQKQAVEQAIHEIKRIRRKPHPKQHELYESVRMIAESLIDVFVNRD